jgi:hypothetical protein
MINNLRLIEILIYLLYVYYHQNWLRNSSCREVASEFSDSSFPFFSPEFTNKLFFNLNFKF